MRKMCSLLLSLIGVSSPSVASEQNMGWLESENGLLKVKAPLNWSVGNNREQFQIMTENGIAVLTIGAYGKEGGSIGEFAQYRFSSVESFYTAINNEQPINNGSFIEFEGIWPGENSPTYYVVAARSFDNAFLSIGLVTDKADFDKNRAMYVSMFNSVSVIN